MTVRTRIAPSPTGAPHIGTAYIALFNYAFAKNQGGSFILRIEDTDRVRSTRESEVAILDALSWLGIAWDEGPDKGGPFGPYRQSERLALYKEHVASLVAAGRAYPCFCSAERMQAVRAEQTAAKSGFVGYDGLCAALSPADAAARVSAGEPHVVRVRTPRDGECVFVDRLRGEVRIPWNTIDDQVLMKTDGYPTYHLANVVDDRLMQITHVIRGEEWISSTPKHVLLYEAFGWQPPEFAHLPLLRNPDKTKLSKRRNPTGILYYRQAGFLPEALLDFLGLISYSMPDGREDFTLADMTDSFDLGRVSLGGPVFDIQKLRHFNGRALRALTPDKLLERLHAWRLNDASWLPLVAMAQPRLEQLADLVPMASFVFADRVACPAEKLATAGGGDGARAVELLRVVQWELEKAAGWDADVVKAACTRIAEKEALPLKKLMPLYFVAFTGETVSLPLFESMALMGRDLCLRRLQYALENLEVGGFALSGKRLKAFTAAYEQTYGAAT